jgi:hypothetical protein
MTKTSGMLVIVLCVVLIASVAVFSYWGKCTKEKLAWRIDRSINKVSIHNHNGWSVEIISDGSGTISYGGFNSHVPHGNFPPKTFDFKEVIYRLTVPESNDLTAMATVQCVLCNMNYPASSWPAKECNVPTSWAKLLFQKAIDFADSNKVKQLAKSEPVFENPTFRPANGYVPDEITAVQIAAAVWKAIYGQADIEQQKPFAAELKCGIWHVRGNLEAQQKQTGLAAEISKSDGQIRRISHTN